MASIESYLSRAVERGRMSPGDKAATMARIRGTTELEDLSDCDMVIEAVTEKPDLKKEIIRKLGRICRPDIILCTNTSTVSVTDLSGSSPNPEKVIGTHFLSPVTAGQAGTKRKWVKGNLFSFTRAHRFSAPLLTPLLTQERHPNLV